MTLGQQKSWVFQNRHHPGLYCKTSNKFPWCLFETRRLLKHWRQAPGI